MTKAVTKGVHHLGLTTPDLAATQQFFTQALGFDQVGEVPDYPAIFVSDGTTLITLWQVQDMDRFVAFDRHHNAGLHHVAFAVADHDALDALHEKVANGPTWLLNARHARSGRDRRSITFSAWHRAVSASNSPPLSPDRQETSVMTEQRPPLPPFTAETAAQKVRAAEDGWNSRNPAKVALAYTADSIWRNRNEFLTGRAEIEAFLTRKWQAERDYRLIKELWAFTDNRIAVRFAYEYRNADDQWVRAYGNENWEFAANGLMARRHASINDLAITEDKRLFRWDLGTRPGDHPGLTELGL